MTFSPRGGSSAPHFADLAKALLFGLVPALATVGALVALAVLLEAYV